MVMEYSYKDKLENFDVLIEDNGYVIAYDDENKYRFYRRMLGVNNAWWLIDISFDEMPDKVVDKLNSKTKHEIAKEVL